MTKLKIKILDILFWIFLIISIIMILWRIFGDSPTDIEIISPFIAMFMMKIWANSEAIKGIGYQVKTLSVNTKTAFEKVKNDFDNLNSNINNLKNKSKRK